MRHEDKDHQLTSYESQGKHPQGKSDAVVPACDRAGQRGRIFASRLTLAGIGPAVEARSGDGGRRVRSALRIRANPKAAHSDGSHHAGLG